MNAASMNSTPFDKIFSYLLLALALIGLYYLYQYLFGPSTSVRYDLLTKTMSATMDPSSPMIITADKLPPLYEGGEFSVSTWVYINNWSYRAGFNKSILSVGGPNFDTIRVYLGGNKPKLMVRFHTRERGAVTNGAPTDQGMAATESLDKANQAATFTQMQTDSALLDSGTSICDLPEIELQRWVNITVAVNGRTVDVYQDGKLARSCVLPHLYKVDAGGYSANLLGYGGFGGLIATTAMYDAALNPEAAYKNYMAGPESITNVVDWFRSFFKI